MYEQQLAKLSCPVQYRKEGAFVPSYHEKYLLSRNLEYEPGLSNKTIQELLQTAHEVSVST